MKCHRCTGESVGTDWKGRSWCRPCWAADMEASQRLAAAWLGRVEPAPPPLNPVLASALQTVAPGIPRGEDRSVPGSSEDADKRLAYARARSVATAKRSRG